MIFNQLNTSCALKTGGLKRDNDTCLAGKGLGATIDEQRTPNYLFFFFLVIPDSENLVAKIVQQAAGLYIVQAGNYHWELVVELFLIKLVNCLFIDFLIVWKHFAA